MSDKKVIQLNDRIPKLKEQRRQKTNRRFIFYIIIFFLLVIVVTYIESPLSNVKGISVSGNRYSQTDQIKTASGLTTHSKIWGVNQKIIMNHLKKTIPSIKSVSVNMHYFSGQVVIGVTEYQRVAYLKTNSSFKPVLANGKFTNSKSSSLIPVNAPILVGFKEGKQLTDLTAQLAKMTPSILYNISEIDFTPTNLYPGGITLYLNDGHQALASISSLAKKMALYPSILANLPKGQKGVVQLRVGTYWSPDPTTTNSSTNGGTQNAK